MSLMEELYRHGDLHGPTRAFFEAAVEGGIKAFFGRRVQLLKSLGVGQDERTLVVGCGFGFLIEVLNAEGYTQVVGVEPLSYFHERMGSENPDAEIVQVTVQGYVSSRVFDWVIDEDALSSVSEPLRRGFLVACEVLAGRRPERVVHLVTTGRPEESRHPAITWKTLSEWRRDAPGHTWIDLSAVS